MSKFIESLYDFSLFFNVFLLLKAIIKLLMFFETVFFIDVFCFLTLQYILDLENSFIVFFQ